MIALEMFQGPFRGFNFVSQPPNITYDRLIVSLSAAIYLVPLLMPHHTQHRVLFRINKATR